MAEFFLVIWVDEIPQKLSLMNRRDIVDGTLRLTSSEKLIETTLMLKFNRQLHRGKIIAFGTKAKIQELLRSESLKLLAQANVAELPEQASVENEEVGTSKRAKLEAVLAKQSGVRQNLQASFDAAADVEKIKKELEQERLLHNELKDKFNELSRELESIREEHEKCSSSESLDIGNGVIVNSATITTIRTISSSLNIFGRNLFRAVFPTDEIVGRSLMGKRCNANKGKEMLPSIDPHKRDAVIDYCLLSYKKLPGTELYKYAKKDLKHSLSSLIMEMNKEAVRIEPEILE